MSEPINLQQLSTTLAEIAEAAARQVGHMLTEAFHQGVSAKQKGGFYDLVTEYDHRAEQRIGEYILRHYPDSSILGEEQGAQGAGSVSWYVDPIDGTTNFATGFPFFCVSIGAAYQQHMLAGVIYDPLRQEMFLSSLAGAFLNDRPIQPGQSEGQTTALLLTDFPKAGSDTPQQDYIRFGKMVQHFKAVRRMGSAALSLAYVACGRADVALEAGINPWDVAAGYLLVQRAGGRFIPLARQGSWDGAVPWLAPGYLALSPAFALEPSVLGEFLNGYRKGDAS